MKKVVLSLALVAMMSVSFVSCKEKEAEPAVEETTEVENTDVEVVAPATADTMVVDSTTVETPAAE